MSEERLREMIREDIAEGRTTIADLARSAGCSRTYLSLWLRNKSTWDARKLIVSLSRYYKRQTLSIRDRLAVQRICEILSHADDKESVIDAVTTTII